VRVERHVVGRASLGGIGLVLLATGVVSAVALVLAAVIPMILVR
jgi:hypothetical protein